MGKIFNYKCCISRKTFWVYIRVVIVEVQPWSVCGDGEPIPYFYGITQQTQDIGGMSAECYLLNS